MNKNYSLRRSANSGIGIDDINWRCYFINKYNSRIYVKAVIINITTHCIYPIGAHNIDFTSTIFFLIFNRPT